ncbi:MAG TPA: DUF4390 domain-containing protein [Methylophilus sp.]
MRCCRNPKLHRWWALWLGVAIWVAVAASNHAHIRSAEMVLRDEMWTLDADLDVQLGSALEEALNKGVTLTFLFEFQITRPMKYWFDDEVLTKRRQTTLSYHALTRQYLLQIDQHQKALDTLSDVKHELGQVRDWRMGPHALLEKNQSYRAALKMHLDRSKLPKALQVDAIGEDSWELVTPTFSWWVKESVR